VNADRSALTPMLHVDMDAFYASVAIRDRPDLQDVPVIVGGGYRGVVLSANYHARHFGVRSGMPATRARRLCPQAVVVAPDYDVFGVVSSAVMENFRKVTPLVEVLSLDEAFLDVRSVRRLHGAGPDIAASIRARVRSETGLVASVGVATTKLLAKLASESAKPDGLLVVDPDGELAFLHALPVQRLWGVGAATAVRLAGLGVRTVGELAATSEATLVRELGTASGTRLHALAHNRDDRDVQPNRAMKSVGHEETFATDVHDRAQLERVLVRHAQRVATRLRRNGLVARTVVVKVRSPDFRTITRSRTCPSPTDLGVDLGRVGLELLAGVDVTAGVRLLGLAAQQLTAGFAVQESLALDDGTAAAGPGPETAPPGPHDAGRRALERAVDRARERYGDDAVIPARLAAPPRSTPGVRDAPRSRVEGP
jgi:DNA polymerase-4